MKKTWLYIGAFIFMVIICVIPFLVNELMNFNLNKVNGEEDTWITFLGSYVGFDILFDIQLFIFIYILLFMIFSLSLIKVAFPN